MNIVVAALMIAALVLPGSAQALTTVSSPPAGQTTSVRSADAVATSADHKTYFERKEAEMAQWRRKIDDFGGQTETKATRAGQAAMLEVKSAWARVEQASRSLDAVSEAGWEDAKADYIRASADLEATWSKVHQAKN